MVMSSGSGKGCRAAHRTRVEMIESDVDLQR